MNSETLVNKRVSDMPKIDPTPQNGRIPTGDKLKGLVRRLLNDRKCPADAVIALTDVYTGSHEFDDGADAKHKMRRWVGDEQRFFPHAAQYEFEAWLLPYWSDIQKLAGSDRPSPGAYPEHINHGNPPSSRLKEVFRTGNTGRQYVKTRDAGRILKDNDLLLAARACPELKALLATLLELCGVNSRDHGKIFQ